MRPIFLFLAVFTFYMASLRYDYVYDSIVWSMLVELQSQRGTWRFESAHYLAFFFAAELSYRVATALFDIRAVPFLQVFSAFFGAAAVTLFEFWLRNVGIRPVPRAVGTLFLATAPTVWRFSAVPEVYTLGLTLLIAGFLMFRQETSWGRRAFSILVPVLGHQSLATFGAAQILTVGRRRIGAALGAATAAAAVFIALAKVAHASSPEIARDWFGWMLGYAEPEPGEALVSWWSSSDEMLRAAVTRPPLEVSFHTASGWTLLGFAFVGLALGGRSNRPLRSLAAAFLVLQCVFVVTWDGMANEFWVFLIPPLGLGMAWFAALGRRHAAAASVLVALNAVGVWMTQVGPHQDWKSNPALVRAEAIRTVTLPGDVIVVPGFGAHYDDKVYIPYFAGREPLYLYRILDSGREPAGRLRAVEEFFVRATANSRVLMVNDAFHPDVADAMSSRYGIASDSYLAVIELWKGPPVGELLHRVVRPPARE